MCIACIEIGNYLYFIDGERNGIYRINLSDGKRQLLKIINNVHGIIYMYAIRVKHKIWFIPSLIGESIVIYDYVKNEVIYSDWGNNKPDEKNGTDGDFYLESDRYIWLFPYYINAAIRIDTTNYNVEFNYRRKYADNTTGISADYLYTAKYKSRIYCCPWKYPRMMYFDLAEKKWGEFFYESDNLDEKIIWEHNGKLYVAGIDLSDGTNIIDIENKIVESSNVFPTECRDYILSYGGIIKRSGNIWITPFMGKGIVCLDQESGIVQCIEIKEKNETGREDELRYQFIFDSENGIVLVSDVPEMPLMFFGDNSDIYCIDNRQDIESETRDEISKLLYMIDQK